MGQADLREFRGVRPRALRWLLLCVGAWLSMSVAIGADRAQPQGRRIALVIGNAAYTASPLTNPINDSREMAAALRNLNFDVVERQNVPLTGFVRAIREFGDLLQEGDTAVFYFAGHGVQVKGRNFLLPVDAVIEAEDEVPYLAVDANQVLEKMELARSRINLVILDACRNNPFPRVMRNAAQGLAQMEAPKGTLIAFATAPGGVAMDGSESNGVYTKHLLTQLRTPGLPVEMVFKRVRAAVTQETKDMQIPWESSSLTGDFYFAGDAGVASGAAPVEQKTVVAAAAPSAIRARPSAKPPMVGDSFTYRLLFGDKEMDKVTMTVTSVGATELIERVTRERFPSFAADRHHPMEFRIPDRTSELETPNKIALPDLAPYGKPTAQHFSGEMPFLLDGGGFSRGVTFKGKAQVVGWEIVEVPAGKFNALRFSATTDSRSTADGWYARLVIDWWYVPHIKRVVKVSRSVSSNHNASKGIVSLELTKFEQK